jgi:hypothetical protein
MISSQTRNKLGEWIKVHLPVSVLTPGFAEGSDGPAESAERYRIYDDRNTTLVS